MMMLSTLTSIIAMSIKTYPCHYLISILKRKTNIPFEYNIKINKKMKQAFILLLLFLASVTSKAQEKYTEYYSNGKIRVSGFVDKNTGKREGHWITYRDDGLKIREENYKNGLKEGPEYTYFDNGNISTISIYRNNLLDGYRLQYHYSDKKNSKKLYYKGFYREGEEDGMAYVYESDGRIISKRRYENGHQVTDTTYSYDKIYYKTWHRVKDTSYPYNYIYKVNEWSEPYKHSSTKVVQNKAITQKKTPLKPKQVRIADQHKTKQTVPNNGKKKQSSPSFNNTRNKSETPKKSKLKVAEDGSIRLE